MNGAWYICRLTADFMNSQQGKETPLLRKGRICPQWTSANKKMQLQYQCCSRLIEEDEFEFALVGLSSHIHSEKWILEHTLIKYFSNILFK